ncbi:MAG: DinB family protein [Acidobacteria bacterium]|nr:DinB family protein [Acidobacteriota bacterium]
MKTRSTSLIDEALEAWAYTREGVIAEVKNLPESALDFKPSEASRTARELVQHIIESGLLMSGELPRPDGDFQRKPYPELLAEYARGVSRHRTKAALMSALRRTHADGATRIRAAGEVGMLQTIRQFNGEPATRFSWMQHGIAHEEYHRGQIALYARLVGRVPALTKLIHGA